MAKQSVYHKRYKIRKVGTGGIEISVPKIVVERAARKEGMSLEKFMESFDVLHLFNDFDGFDAAYRFVPVAEEMDIEETLREKEVDDKVS